MKRVTCLAAAFATALDALAAAPRAEVQVGLCEAPDALAARLGLDEREAPYETWLFDDPSLALLSHKVRLRLRARTGAAELTLKVGAQDCAALPRGGVRKREGKCEYDVHDGRPEGAVSLSSTLDDALAREVIAGRVPVAQALGPAQVAFLRDAAHLWPLPQEVRALGPIANRTYTSGPYAVDVSTLPHGERYAEISIRVPVERVERARADLARYLARKRVDACVDQDGQAPAKLRAMLPR